MLPHLPYDFPAGSCQQAEKLQYTQIYAPNTLQMLQQPVL
jgi:hypothetical protein